MTPVQPPANLHESLHPMWWGTYETHHGNEDAFRDLAAATRRVHTRERRPRPSRHRRP